MNTKLRLGTTLMTTAMLAACGGYSGSAAPSGPLAVQAATPAGDNQEAPAGGDLPSPVRIVALRGGVPAAGVTVNWSATGNGALMVPAVGVTGADGISSSVWHLGADVGRQSAQATVAGAESGSPVTFTANALTPGDVPPGVTIRLTGINTFEPNVRTVAAGTRVTWVWEDGFHNVNHQVTAGSNAVLARSGNPSNPPASYAFTFTQPGTYVFFCEVHGSLTAGMRGTIVVE